MARKKKQGPLYNYRSPRDYEVFNWGNEADPPFKLKSGNTPLFKHVGSSPNNQGTRFSTNTDTSTTAGTDTKKENKDIVVKGSGKRTAGQILAEGITGGLDAVYGTGKVKFDNTVQVTKGEVDKETNTISENIIAGETDQMPDEDWKAGQEKAKEGGEDLDALVAKRETLTKDSAEWKENQNKINEALGNKKRH